MARQREAVCGRSPWPGKVAWLAAFPVRAGVIAVLASFRLLIGCAVGAVPFRYGEGFCDGQRRRSQAGLEVVLTAVMGVLLLLPGSIFIYQYIDEKERQGGTVRMHWLAIFFYDIFGRLGVTLLVAVVGIGVLIAAVLEFRKSRRTA